MAEAASTGSNYVVEMLSTLHDAIKLSSPVVPSILYRRNKYLLWKEKMIREVER